MKAIILGAGQGIVRQNEEESFPKCLITDPFGQRVLDWILNSLKLAGVRDIVFVGGFHLEKVIPNYPGLKYYINPNWDHTNMVESLFCAAPELDGPFLVSYSDVVYRPNVAIDLLNSDADIALAVDRDWKERYVGRTADLLTGADKTLVENGRIVRIGKEIGLDLPVWGEFTGLALFNREGARILKEHYAKIRNRHIDRPFHEAANILQAGLPDLLQDLIDAGVAVKPVGIRGDWAELDAPQDLAQYVFGTKAETLERLQPIIKNASICEQIKFTVSEWESSPSAWIRNIQNHFQPHPIVVRSSALDEDSWNKSNAGKYSSVIDVNSSDPTAIAGAIDRVIASYAAASPENVNSHHQVLVQPKVKNVALSGVLFTRALETGAPYYAINYDDSSSLTHTVTAGSSERLKMAYVLKGGDRRIPRADIDRLVAMARELEHVVGYDSLDIEFALTADGVLYVLQVRPIVAHKNYARIHDDDFLAEIAEIDRFVRKKFRPHPNCHGKTTIFGVMPDWNPAEIIGLCPKPLALSLYQYLITDQAWGRARAMIGYEDTFPEPLMVSLAGRPYIDTRVSFNSFLPEGLQDNLSDKLADHYLRLLKDNPDAHDKIEFEIAITCFSFDAPARLSALRQNGFSQEEISLLSESLLHLTRNILNEKAPSIGLLQEDIRRMNKRRETLLANEVRPEDVPGTVYSLLNDCIRYGTVPFSILARYAFIGTAFLKSFVSAGILGDGEYHGFLNSIQTVATRFIRDLDRVKTGKLPREKFLERYGHLRPGTYDILSPRYDELPDLYLNFDESAGPREEGTQASPEPREFGFSPAQTGEIQKLLTQYRLDCTAERLTGFIRSGIEARESSKFEFTRNLSAAISLLARFGDYHGFSREDVSHVPIHHFLKLTTENPEGSFKKHFQGLVLAGRARYRMTQAMCLPDLIRSPEDLSYFQITSNQPNFITQKRVTADAAVLVSGRPDAALKGKIVLIEGADPGFDWIFGHHIGGLITRYGGAASHMAIRAAEFGLPAAIGCGTSIFNSLLRARKIELNCAARQIRTVG